MKKKILSVALVVTMAATAFTGCGKRSSKTETTKFNAKDIDFKTNQELTSDKIELTVWESSAGPDEFIKQAGEYFTELYPNITIKYVNVESTDANSKIVLDGPGGQGPDLFATAHNNAGVMASGAVIEPVPESEKEIVAASCSASALQGATLNAADGSSTLYGYPVSVETYALFYNKALISEEEVPKTMEELLTYIENFQSEHKNDGVQPFLFDAGNAYYSVMFTSSPTNKLYGENGNDIKNSYMNTDEAVAQMADFTALAKAINQPAGDIDYKHNDALFGAGQLAMNVSGAWNIKTFEENGIDFGITAIPSLTGSENAPTNFMGVRCMFVSAYSTHKAEAIAFAEFLMTKEMQQLRCELTSTMPARDDVLENITDEKIKAYMEGLNSQIQYSYPMPNMAQASLFWTAFASAYSNIWNGETTDIQAELNTADASATKK
ncbi:MAG: extracellular solute-binding protein [Lachnospiraceae bacterium]|nr:extracellular solute-binding protein [Lachnospiraceae bacterium]